MPRASRCSAGPTVAPRMSATSASVRAANWPTVSTPRRCSFSSATGPMPHSRRTDSPSSSGRSSSRRTTRIPSGLASPGGDLGDLLARSGADRGHQPGLGAHEGAQVGAEALDLGRIGAGQFHRLAERLVERKLFQHRQNRPDGVEHPPAGHPVDHSARRQHHRARPDQPAGLMHRHGRARPEDPGLVAGAGHHAAAAETADQHRAAAQGRSGQLLDRREERVHVEVQDPAFHDCRC